MSPGRNGRTAVLLLCAAAGSALAAAPAVEKAAVEGLITRVAPGLAGAFILELLDSSACEAPATKCFGYRQASGAAGAAMIQLEGTSGVELAMAFNHYLKYVTNSSVSWWRTGGRQLVNAATPTNVASPVRIQRALTEHYYANVCTFSYSFVWYTLDDWVAEIDWMALNGVTLPLAYTGQEKIYQKVYNKLGITDKDLEGFFGGPAFLTWARGQGLLGWGGPLPQSWIDGQWTLQRQILPLMRAFGMKPVLPAFQGNVPLAFLDVYPKANASRVGSCPQPRRAEYACAPWLDALDPMFNKTADLFLQTLIEDFGTDHYYAADGTFSHTAAPWAAANPLARSERSGAEIDVHAKQHSAAAFAGMTRTDPDATWLFQTWSWVYGAKDAYMRGWIEGVPEGRLVLLDLFAEGDPIWKKTESYYGAPFLWCMLHDFGGNDGMWGWFTSLSEGPTAARKAGNVSILGTGLTMEGTNQNAVVYEFMNEMAYRSDPVASLPAWAEQWAARRYGYPSAHAARAWRVLEATAYNATAYNMMTSKDTLTAIPFGAAWDVLAGAHWYNETTFLTAWEELLAAGEEPQMQALARQGVWTYRHDLVDVTRQALAKLSTHLYNTLNATAARRDPVAILAAGEALGDMADELDVALGSVPGFLFGTWIADAERWGLGDANATALMSWNARTQVTMWNYPLPAKTNITGPVDQTPTLMDYANKQWAGLMRTYYGQRWRFYTELLVEAAAAGGQIPLDESDFHVKLIAWYDTWRETHTSFPTEPVGDTHAICLALYKKYAPMIRKAGLL